MAENPLDEPEVTEISLDYSFPSYLVEYTYDPEDNVYLRFVGGKEHIDHNAETQIAAKNVIVQYADYWIIAGDDQGRREMDTIGTGDALVFINGDVIEGVWEKENQENRTQFYNADHELIKLNPGSTWIEVIKPEQTVEYS